MIFEPSPSGHRFEYVRHLALEAHRQGRSVTLLTAPDAIERGEYRQHLADLDWLDVAIDDRLASHVRGRGRVARLVSHPSVAVATDVLIPDGDPEAVALLASRIGKRQGPTYRLLLMRSYPSAGFAGHLKFMLKSNVVRALQAAGVLTFKLVDGDGAGGLRAIPVNDPIEMPASAPNQHEARDRFGLAPLRYVGLFGGIDFRKCPDLALDAVALAAEKEPTALVVAGRSSADATAVLRDGVRRGLVAYWADDYVPSDELDALIRACDAVLLLYRNEGPSGIQKRAQALGVPCVVAGSKSLMDRARRTGSGLVAELDATSVADALRAAYKLVPAVEGMGSPETFARALMDHENHRLGRSSRPRLMGR